jgi:hypothetical protein
LPVGQIAAEDETSALSAIFKEGLEHPSELFVQCWVADGGDSQVWAMAK